MDTGLVIIGLLYIGLSITAVVNLFGRGRQRRSS
jgi:hypothetical protein